MEDRDPKKEVKVNKFALDKGLEEQPDLFLDWATEHAEAIGERNELKYELDEKIKPKLDLEIRKDPKKFRLEKITESVVFSTILLQREYGRVSEKLMRANNRVNKLLAVREAFDHRRSSLKYLADLWVRDYYGQSVGGNKDFVKADQAKIDTRSSEEQRRTVEKAVRRRSYRG